MKFSDYDEKKSAQDRKADKSDRSERSGKPDKTQAIDPKTAKMLKNLLGKYEGKSRDELMASVLSIAQKNRSEGKLSDEEIDYFYSLIAPMLDEEKLKTLDEVVDKIKTQ